MEGGARDVLLTPLDHQGVAAGLFQLVGHTVFQVALMLNQNLMAGGFWAVDAHQEHVVTWEGDQRPRAKAATRALWVEFSLPALLQST